MRVLVWKYHGYIKVYAADTAEQLEGIVSTMIASLDDGCLEDTIKLVTDHISKHRGDGKEILRAFNTIRNAVTDIDHETFEDVFLTDVLEECN